MCLKNGIKQDIKKMTLLMVLVILFTNIGMQAEIRRIGKDQDFKLISSAVEHAVSGDTLIIYPGKYSEGNIIIDKPLTLLGKNSPVISGEYENQIITVISDNVVIKEITFSGAGISYIDDNAAVYLDGVKNCVIENNKFDKNFFSIYLANSSDCLILNNDIKADQKRETASGNGIHLWYCKNITIESNHIKGHRDGIYFEFVQSSSIRRNVSENNLRYGLHFMFSDSCKYYENSFIDNGAGVAVMYTEKVEMYRNLFKDNRGGASYGLLLKELTDSKIHSNEFVSNTCGIYSEGSNRINVYYNTFRNNGRAIRLMANSMDNNFYENNFIGNSFDVTTNSRQNFNTFINNYWSGYNGYDLNRDGIGDVPYHPVKLFSIIVEKNKPAIILLRSFFVQLIDIAEQIFPTLTPETLVDKKPLMRKRI